MPCPSLGLGIKIQELVMAQSDLGPGPAGRRKTVGGPGRVSGQDRAGASARAPGDESSHRVTQEDGMLKKFQDFAVKGNAFDLAVGVIIGAAFGGIVTSLVSDIFMPIIGAITGGLDFSNYFVGLSSNVTAGSLAEARKQGAVLAWGNFLTIVINFLIVAGVLFMLVNMIQRFRQQAEDKPAAPPRQEVLLEEIRDLLAKRP
jgi:large conductance mechanosensitive channel